MPAQTQYQIFPEVELDARPRYFDGQFLRSQDFVDEQRYHVDRLRREIRGLHVAGIAAGFVVSADGVLKVAVGPGTAIDRGGRQIVLIAPASVVLAADLPRPASYILVVRYSERGDASLGGRDTEPGTRGFTRFREEAQFEVLPAQNPVPSEALGLALLALDNGGNVTVSTPADLRRYSGLRLPGPDDVGPTLTTGGDAAPRRLDLSGDLHVTGTLSIDNGVIQRGGDAITATKDLGLYSQVGSNWVRYVSTGGRHVFFNDGGIGTTADLTVESGKTTVRGALSVGEVTVAGLLRTLDVEWGESNSRTQVRENAGLRGDAGARSGFFQAMAASPANNYPPGSANGWHLLDVRHNNPANNYAMQLAGSFADQRLWLRKLNNDPATPWRRVLTTDDLGVTLDGKVGVGVGLLGTSAAPRAHLDVAQNTRSGTHPAAVKGLYVTGDFGAVVDGAEFRHSNATRGVGIGYAGIYATGLGADLSLNLAPRGNGGVGVGTSAFNPSGKFEVRLDAALAGWDRLVVTGTNTWNSIDTQVTIGAGGASGLILSNPHVGWLASEKRASIRYAPTGADPSRTSWDVGAREDGAFSFLASGATTLRVDTAGTTVSGTLRVPTIGVNLAGATPRAQVEVNALTGNWLFLRQDRDVGGGGGFVFHNAWGASGTAGGVDERNRLEIGYQPASGDMRWGQLVIHGPTSNVGINYGTPKTTLHVGGRMMLDAGVIQRGGDAITSTSDLGLYSQVETGFVRFVSKNGRHVFFNDGGVGTTADLTIEASKTTVRGTLQANRYTADNSLVLNDFQTVNPSSNVYLAAPGNDRDAWIYRENSASSNWGIYHRQIDSTVKGLPQNSIGFVGGGDSTLKAFISLQDGTIGAKTIGVGLAADVVPKAGLHVAGRIMVDNGVIQRGGDTMVGTSDLGLYSQVESNWVRYVSKTGRHAFFNDGGVGTTADLTVEASKTTVRGALAAGTLSVGDTTVSGLLRTTTLEWGSNNMNTQTRDNAGLRGDAGARSGFFETSTASAAENFPPGSGSWWHLLDVRHSNQANNYAMQLAGSFYDQQLWFRKINNDPATSWRRVMTSDDLSVNNGENLRIVRGTVNGSSGVESGAGFSVARTGTTGMVKITFSTAFASVPTVVVTQQYPDSNDNGSNNGGDTRDNAVVVSVAKEAAYIKTGNGSGDGSWRRFHFIAMGT